MWDHLLGALAAYKRIIAIASCANIVSGFVTFPCHYLCSHLNRFRFTTSHTKSIPILSVSSALATLSLRDTPCTHQSYTIPISVRSNLCTLLHIHCPCLTSLPFTIALLAHVIYTFPFIFKDTSFLVKIPDNSLDFPPCTTHNNAALKIVPCNNTTLTSWISFSIKKGMPWKLVKWAAQCTPTVEFTSYWEQDREITTNNKRWI